MIRKATFQDIPVLVSMAKAMAEESPMYRDVSFNYGVMSAFLEIMLENPDQYCVFISYSADGLETGMFGGIIAPYFFSETEFYSSDIGLYVAPEHRGGRYALELTRAYEKWAADMGIRPERVRLGETTGNPGIGAFYEKMGYSQIGRLYSRMEA